MQTSPPSEEQIAITPSESPLPADAPPAPDSSAKLQHVLISFSAAAVIISFFFPWINFLGANMNGYDIAKHFSSYWLVWFVPLLAGLVLLLNVARLGTDLIRRIAGLCPFGVLVY